MILCQWGRLQTPVNTNRTRGRLIPYKSFPAMMGE